MYLTVSAVLTLMLLAWHFSIQAAAHDAAIVQVRAWMQSIGASAGRVQFRLLRGALTIEHVKADVQGNPLSIQSIFIKGNPVSITTNNPLLSSVQIEGLSLDLQDAQQNWAQLSPTLPTALETIFRHAKVLTIRNSHISHITQDMDTHIVNIEVSGAADNREVYGNGYFENDGNNGSWTLESFIPAEISLQTGKLLAKGEENTLTLLWAGAWQQKNMQISFSEQNTDDSSLHISLKQDQSQWSGNIQAQSWPVHFEALDSIITGKMNISGTPQAWQLRSSKLNWEESFFKVHQTFIQNMVSHNLVINQAEKQVEAQRLDIDDANIEFSALQPLWIATPWKWNIPSINIQNLYSTFDAEGEAINLPALSGIASFQNQTVQFDLSAQVDQNQFWRVRSSGKGAFTLSTTHVPLLQLRNLLPKPIQHKSYTVQGSTSMNLKIYPDKQWATSGKVHISELLLAAKDQKFSALEFELRIYDANKDGVHRASILADTWRVQFPLTPRQAWGSDYQLNKWAEIPWSLDEVVLKHGKILIGNENNVWLSRAYLQVKNWQKKQPAKLKLLANVGLAPLHVSMTLKQNQEHHMGWKTLDVQTQHANMFFLKDWLKISGLPQVNQGHFSLSLKASKHEGLTSGEATLRLYRLGLASSKPNNYLQQSLGYPDSYKPNPFIKLKTSFSGQDDWATLAGKALLTSAKAMLQSDDPSKSAKASEPQRLGSLRIQQDPRLSLNERTRLRKMIKTILRHKGAIVELTPDIGTAELTPDLLKKVMRTEQVIQSFIAKRGIKRARIYPILPTAEHKSNSGAGAVHINLVQ